MHSAPKVKYLKDAETNLELVNPFKYPMISICGWVYYAVVLRSCIKYIGPEDHWSCIAHLIAEDMLKSAVIEEKTFKHSPWAGADKPLRPKF